MRRALRAICFELGEGSFARDRAVRLALGIVAMAAAVGCGRIGFPAHDAAVDAVPADAFMGGGFAYLGSIGRATCTGSTIAIPIEVPVAAGVTLIVRVGLRNVTLDRPLSAIDDAGNTYAVDVVQRRDTNRILIATLSSTLVAPLAAQQQIVLTVPDAAEIGAVIDAFDGVGPAPYLVTTAGAEGDSHAFTVSAVTPEDNLLVYCALAHYNTFDVVPETWAATAELPVDCGGSSSELGTHGGALLAAVAGSYACSAQFAGPVSAHWAMTLVAYR